jgi:hypothetical protein
LAFLTIISSVMALPPSQIPCFGSEGCPERVNPEDGEYYAIQCATNTIWVWRTTPNLMLATSVSIFQINALIDDDLYDAPFNVTVTRSGDTITISGDSGNLAPEPGEKSFSWSECLDHNGGLPELPPIGQELTHGQIECLSLTDEQERSLGGVWTDQLQNHRQRDCQPGGMLRRICNSL